MNSVARQPRLRGEGGLRRRARGDREDCPGAGRARGQDRVPVLAGAALLRAGSFKTRTYAGKTYLSFLWQDQVAEELETAHADLVRATKARFATVAGALRTRYYDVLHRLFVLVSELDAAASSAAVATAYSYTAPSILGGTTDGGPQLVAHGLRHPIIERTDNATEYVPNDAEFRSDGLGYLVHGVNAAGKSSLYEVGRAGRHVAQADVRRGEALRVPPVRAPLHAHLEGRRHPQRAVLVPGRDARDRRHHPPRRPGRSSSATSSAAAPRRPRPSPSSARACRRSRRRGRTHARDPPARASNSPDAASNAKVRSVPQRGVRHRRHDHLHAAPHAGLRPGHLRRGGVPRLRAPEGVHAPARSYRSHLKTQGRSRFKVSSYNAAVMYGTPSCVDGCRKPAEDIHHLCHQATANATGHLADGRSKNARSNLIPLCKEHHKVVHRPDAPEVAARWRTSNSADHRDPRRRAHQSMTRENDDKKERRLGAAFPFIFWCKL